MKASVTSIVAPGIDGWMWSAADDATPLAAADRLIAAAPTIDLEAAAARADALLKAEKFGQDLEQALAQAASFRAFMDKLIAERKEMLATGDPHQLREQALRRREEAMRTVDQAQVRTAAIIEETGRLRPVLDRLLAQQDGAICPTCGRPIEANDIAITAGLFTARLESLDDERAALASQRAAASTEAKATERVIATEAERAKQLDMLLGRIANGEQRIADAEQGALDIRSALTHHLDAHGMATPPSSDEIDTVKRRLETSRRIAGSLPLLRRLAASMRQAQEAARALETELAAAGDVAYDPAAHDTARAALKSAENALARIGQIDALLAARPEREAEIAAAESGIARLADERAGLIGARATLAFDPGALLQARTAERDAIQAERDARDARAAALAHEADAVKYRDALLAEHERIRRLIERADRRLREAGELDMMYREFNGFEQFVADRLTPQLADYTAELLRAITEEKYDDVVFNSNYGIRVFDGSDEHFPVDEFSGGERDVIALCARLALSRLIGGQAHNPPGFMVLDEVFGSLDRERRGQVLETLGALAGTAEAFHQLFIISHVDDVRSSPIFNEVWRVAEGVDGISRLENLNLTGGFEDA
ncbi:MAG: hypothetical protein IT336_08225 [Thermomicrobiales bacterium]|nr:hypothetical protein [Thermomicrobiales bacterium]